MDFNQGGNGPIRKDTGPKGRTNKGNFGHFRLSDKILDLPEITRKQLPIGFSVRCARARADAFCLSVHACIRPFGAVLWSKTRMTLQGGHYPPHIRRVGPAGSLFQQVICIRCDKSFFSLFLFL